MQKARACARGRRCKLPCKRTRRTRALTLQSSTRSRARQTGKRTPAAPRENRLNPAACRCSRPPTSAGSERSRRSARARATRTARRSRPPPSFCSAWKSAPRCGPLALLASAAVWLYDHTVEDLCPRSACSRGPLTHEPKVGFSSSGCALIMSTRILGRRTAPFRPFLSSNRPPHGVTPRS